MFVEQISVFLENTAGSLLKMTDLLAENRIDITALSVADTEHFGVVRLITGETERAVAVLRGAGYVARLTEVLAVRVADEPGGLTRILGILNDAGLSVEYIYSFVRGEAGCALIIFRLNDTARAAQVLTEKGVSLASQSDIKAL